MSIFVGVFTRKGTLVVVATGSENAKQARKALDGHQPPSPNQAGPVVPVQTQLPAPVIIEHDPNED